MTFAPSDVPAMLAELKRDGTNVDLMPGTYQLPSGLHQVGEGTTLTGHGARLCAPNPCRIVTRKPGVTLRDFTGYGYLTLYNYASRYTVEDVQLDHSLDGVTHLNHGAKAAATGMFMTWLPVATTRMLEKLTYRRCTGWRSYHHTFNLNLEGAPEGGEFRDVLYEDCRALSAGSGFEPQNRSKGAPGTRDWSCGFDIPDAGDITRLTVRRCVADDVWQDGFHLDGSWSGHRQNQTGILFEDCLATRCGRRCSTDSVEQFRSGYYLQTGVIRNCRSENCSNAGFGLLNEIPNSLVVENCRDVGSTYGMILNYRAPGAKVQFTSEAAKVQAFVGQGGSNGGTLDLTLIDPPARAVTFGRALRIDYHLCPGHAAQQRDKYDRLGYTLSGSGITIRAAEKPTVDVWPTSRMNGNPAFVISDVAPYIPPDVPHPIPSGSLYVEDGQWIWYQAPEGRPTQWRDGERAIAIPADVLAAGDVILHAYDGAVWVGARGIPTRTLGFLPDEIRQWYHDVRGVV